MFMPISGAQVIRIYCTIYDRQCIELSLKCIDGCDLVLYGKYSKCSSILLISSSTAFTHTFAYSG